MKLFNRNKKKSSTDDEGGVSTSQTTTSSSSSSAVGGSKSYGNGNGNGKSKKKKNGVKVSSSSTTNKKKSGGKAGAGGVAVAPVNANNNSNNDNSNSNSNATTSNNMTVFRVTVPENTNPGEEFQVYAGSRIVRVRCPLDSRPGQSLQITVPADNNNNGNGNGNGQNDTTGRSPRRNNSNVSNNTNGTNNSSGSRPRSRLSPDNDDDEDNNNTPQPPSLNYQQSTGSTSSANSKHSRNSNSNNNDDNVRRIADSNPPAYMVSVPDGVDMGSQFPVTIRGQQLMVTCPPNARPGMSVRIVPPPAPPPSQQQEPIDDNNNIIDNNDGNVNVNVNGEEQQRQQQIPPTTTDLRQNASTFGGTSSDFASQQQQKQRQRLPPKQEKEKTQLFEVEVPRGVQPGAPFALLAGGVRVLVTCPANAGPGQRIRFKLPLALTQATQQHQQDLQSNPEHAEMQEIKLKYDKDGWTRTVRANDLKFQWIRMDDKGGIDLTAGGRFHMEKSAYVRRLEFRSGEDPRVRTGILSLVPATESVVDSKIKSADGRDLVTYSDLARAQMKIFDEKTQWFQDTCAQLCVEWNEGHMRMNIRRSHMLGDSVDAVMSLSRKDLRKLWRFEFIGEMGIDAGGLAREWFEIVCSEIFDPDMGLWMSSVTNQMSMTINPASGTSIYKYVIRHVVLCCVVLYMNEHIAC
jgi:hypothetical protein